MGQVYCSIKKVEAHIAYISPLVASIPPSIGIKYSGLSLQTVLLNSLTVNEQIVVPPSCRAVYLCLPALVDAVSEMGCMRVLERA